MTRLPRFILPWISLLAALIFLHAGITMAAKASDPSGYLPGKTALDNRDTSGLITTTLVFTNASLQAGVNASHHPVYFGTGQAWGDYNNDSWVDLYVTDNSGPNSLFRNQGDGTFSQQFHGIASLPGDTSGGAVFADYDNDGWKDLYILNLGPNKLLRNRSGSGFQDVTILAGVGDPGQGQTAAWGDFDKDGYLDLYVTNWYFQGDESSPYNLDRLYHNNGNGIFTDASTALGESRGGPGYAASFVDYDNDGDLDIYLVKDKDAGNVLWRNDGPGCEYWCFTDISESSGADARVLGMGLAIGDYDNDGDLDFYFSDLGPMVLLQNQTSQGSPTFLNAAHSAGVDHDAIGWGSVFLDFDNDGWRDLYLATMDSDPARANRLYHNQGDGTFADISAGGGADDPGPTIGVAYADYDRDGHVDLVIGNWGHAYELYRNTGMTGSENHYLVIRLTGAGPVNRDAIGARVYLTTSDGNTQMQEVINGSSIGSGSELALHFGLGQNEVESLTIVWPDGLVETFIEVPIDSTWEVTYPVPGLDLSAGKLIVASPGTLISIPHLLTNVGTRQDTFDIYVASIHGWATVSPLAVTLAPAESELIRIEVQVPDVPLAADQIQLAAVSQNNPAIRQTVLDTLIAGIHWQFLPQASR